MRKFTGTIGEGRAQIDVVVEIMDREDLTPEEDARVIRTLRRMYGEPTPEMYEPEVKARRRVGKKGEKK
jgi:hypothetical protein